MSKLNLKGKEIRSIGFPESPVVSVAINIISKNFKQKNKQQALDILSEILASPNEYLDDETYSAIASLLIPKPVDPNAILMNSSAVPVSIFGNEFIEPGARSQMEVASRLPVAVAGALMPDAHQGYGLPIGGVLATENAVIPYGVGVDIGCRMCLSIFNIPPGELETRQPFFIRELNAATLFGAGKEFSKTTDHDVLDRTEFNEIAILKGMQSKAAKQIGSSGSGNHFVEFGIVDIVDDKINGVPQGKYVGLLSHSGSRGLGANIAAHYTRVAKEKRKLPPEAANLAWLSLDEEEGIEYWMSMQLAGDYASACHHIIHDKIALQLGMKPMAMVENHHNFAWKEIHDGRELIVHRKGATPAGKGVLGIIPGSMTAPGFIVSGRGDASSLSSASHGAGRQMSRTAALASVTAQQLQDELNRHGVKLIGGGPDEAPFAYKNIEDVMRSQQDLVDITGRFYPKIVKMDDTPPRSKYKKKNKG